MKQIVDISDAKVSNNVNDELITYSLGSCIGVALYDPVVKAGGLLHFQLPNSKTRSGTDTSRPLMYADSGMQFMLDRLLAFGINKKRLIVKIAGGAQMMNDAKMFQIGKRNYAAVRQYLWKNGMFIDAEDIGGKAARNMSLSLADGSVSIKCQGQTKKL